jgi:hypothetical protein
MFILPFRTHHFLAQDCCQVYSRCRRVTVAVQPVGHNLISFAFEGRVRPAFRQQVSGARRFLVIHRTAEALGGI